MYVHMYTKRDSFYHFRRHPTPLQHTSTLCVPARFSTTLSYSAQLGGDSRVKIRQRGLEWLKWISGQIKKIIQKTCLRVSYPPSKNPFLRFYSKCVFKAILRYLGFNQIFTGCEGESENTLLSYWIILIFVFCAPSYQDCRINQFWFINNSSIISTVPTRQSTWNFNSLVQLNFILSSWS